MAKGKPTGDETPRPQKSGTTRSTPREKTRPEKNNDQDAEDVTDSGGNAENPDWWRGDPGRRGEVL